MKKQIHPYWIIFAIIMIVVALLVVFSNKKAEEIDSELESLIRKISSTNIEARNLIKENEDCFNDESLENYKSGDCVIAIRFIQTMMTTAHKETLDNFDSYYQNYKLNLSNDSYDNYKKRILENLVRLIESDMYKELMNVYDKYFTAYIEWHKYFRDIVDIKGVDDMSSEELLASQPLAQAVVDTSENLQLTQNRYSDYLYENFDKEFTHLVWEYSKNLKE